MSSRNVLEYQSGKDIELKIRIQTLKDKKDVFFKIIVRVLLHFYIRIGSILYI